MSLAEFGNILKWNRDWSSLVLPIFLKKFLRNSYKITKELLYNYYKYLRQDSKMKQKLIKLGFHKISKEILIKFLRIYIRVMRYSIFKYLLKL